MPGPEASYDWDLAATAAHSDDALANSRAGSRAPSRFATEQGGECGGVLTSTAAETAQAAAVGEPPGGAAKTGLKSLMTRLGQDIEKAGGQVALGFQKALDETHRGLQKVKQVTAGEALFTTSKSMCRASLRAVAVFSRSAAPLH